MEDLLTVCKYCGCVISSGRGKHGKHIETPLGQSHPISIHGGSEPDAGLANDVITAVKNLDENWGEIIFPASTSTVSVDNLKQKAEAHFKSGKTANSNGPRNYYQEQLREKLKAEAQRTEQLKKQEAAEQTKKNEIQQSKIQELRSNIKAQVSRLKEVHDRYSELLVDLPLLIATGLERKSATEQDIEDLKELRDTLNQKLKNEFEANIKLQQHKIKKDISDLSSSENEESIEILEENYLTACDVAEKRVSEEEQYSLEVYSNLSDMINNSDYSKISDAVLEINTLFSYLQIFKKEVHSETDTNQKAKEVAVLIKRTKREIQDKKMQLCKGQISPEEATDICNKLAEHVDTIYSRYKNYMQIKAMIGNISDLYSEVKGIKKSFSEDKDKIIEDDYSNIEQKINDFESLYKEKVIKVSLFGFYEQTKLDSDEQQLQNPGINYDTKPFEILKEEFLSRANEIKELIKNVRYLPESPTVFEQEIQEKPVQTSLFETETIPSSTTTEPQEKVELPQQIAVSSSLFAIKPVNIIPSVSTKEEDDSDAHVGETLESAQSGEKQSNPITAPKQKTAKPVRKSATPQIEQPKKTSQEKPADSQVEPDESASSTKQTQVIPTAKLQTTSNSKTAEVNIQPTSFKEQLINNISRKIALLQIPAVYSEIAEALNKLFTQQDISKLQKCSTQEYTLLLAGKINQLSSTNVMKQIKRAQTFTVLQDMEKKEPALSSELYKNPAKNINSAMKEIAQNNSYKQYKPNMKELNSSFIDNMKNLSAVEKNSISNILFEGLNMEASEKTKIDGLISSQKKYLSLITDTSVSKNLRTMALKVFLNDFDSAFNTNYSSSADNFIEEYEKKKQTEEKMKILDTMDWSDITDSVF